MLSGKIAVITGGARGIGAAAAAKLAAHGADIAVIYAGSRALAAQVCSQCSSLHGVKARAYQCSVADFDAVRQTVTQIRSDFGTVHILVNNAGITRDGLVAAMSEQTFDEVLDVNLKGAFNMIRHCAGRMIRNRFGRIINITSVAALTGNPGQANYSASKAGLIGLTKTVARELAPRGITCNAVAPGFIATDMTKELSGQAAQLAAGIPLGHMGTAEDVAQAVAFLADAPYITGEVLRVDGGIAM